MEKDRPDFLSKFMEVFDDVNVVKKTVRLIEKLLGPAVTEVGSSFHDFVQKKRAQNQLNYFIALNKQIELHGLQSKIIPAKVMFPLLENVSLEDDEDLRMLWRNLILNGLKEGTFDQQRLFVNVLSQISPSEAEILELVFNEELEQTNNIHYRGKHVDAKFIMDYFKQEEQKCLMMLDNLERLNLIRFKLSTYQGKGIGMLAGSVFRLGQITLTVLGKEFVKACEWQEDQ